MDGHSSGTPVAGCLSQPTRMGRGNPPAVFQGRYLVKDQPQCGYHPYSVLLPVGFTMPLPLPDERCALTAPFHPYPDWNRGGLLSVALSL